MASLERRSDRYRIVFRYDGRKFHHSLRTAEPQEARSCLHRLEENLRLLERGRLVLPVGADLATFLLSDGRLTERPKVPPPLTLSELTERYLSTHSQGAMEANSLETVSMHLRHFKDTLGARFPVATLSLAHLQAHVDRRARENGIRNQPVSATTIRKEVATFRAAWNWAAHMGLTAGHFPHRGLKYPKVAEKPPFQTFEEIERQITRGGLTAPRQKELWDGLFLTLPEIQQVLRFVNESARHPFLQPMFCFAAHTGARRSEMLRLRIDDIDLAGETVLLHEKKRAKGRRTTRRVPLSRFLTAVLRDWLVHHPGGQFVFCHQLEVTRSKKNRTEVGPLTRNEANDHFKRTLAGSRWEVLRGWHVFRHSFASNCAAKGIDQRVIDEWMGHQTEEMRRRYRHLFPGQQRQAIRLVFG